MSDRTIDTLTWVLIYGGLLVAGLGLAVGDRDTDLRVWLLAGGAVAAMTGVVLIGVRARRSRSGADTGRR